MASEVTAWQGSCEDCFHWQYHNDGSGHCGIKSCRCATAIMEKDKAPRFLSRFELLVEQGGMAGYKEE